MPKKTADTWTDEEELVIEFFMDFIPILMEAKADLESKNLLNGVLPTKKNS